MENIEIFKELINDNDIVADIGCDQALLGIKLAKRGIKSYGSDISNKVIEKAKDNTVPSITVAVNQVMGETVSFDSSTTVTVDQQQGKAVDTPETKTVTINQQAGDTIDSSDNATRVVNEVNGSSIDDSPLTSSGKSNDNTGYNKNNNDNDIDTLL